MMLKPLTSKPGEFRGRCCRIVYVDRDAFEAHAKRHTRSAAPGGKADFVKLVDPWDGSLRKPLRLKDAGQPLSVYASQRLYACGTCGLEAEHNSTQAFTRWWDEHLEGCRIAQAGAAS